MLRSRWSSSLKHTYGITADDYDDMYWDQDGLCGICLDPIKYRNRSTHIDHDHETNSVRRLLCDQCNWLLGNARDDPWILMRAVEYLEKHDMDQWCEAWGRPIVVVVSDGAWV